jgi:hypothetical protein
MMTVRTRGAGVGADVGNRPASAVEIHAGNNIYYRTRTHGAGIGKRTFIGGVTEAGE